MKRRTCTKSGFSGLANPDLTQCFQNTVLVWVPCIYLWLLAPFYCLHLYCHDRGRIRMSCLCTAKMVLGFLLASFGFVEFFYILLERSQEIQQHMVFLLSPIIRSMTVILALCIIQLERVRGCRSSVFLFLFWVLELLTIRFWYVHPHGNLLNMCSVIPQGIASDIVRYLAFFSYFTIQLAQLFLVYLFTIIVFFVDDYVCESSPRFLPRLVVKGYQLIIDIWQEKALASGVALGSRLPDQAQLLRKLQKEQSSGFFLLRTLARKFGPYFLTGTLCIIFHDAFMFAIPQVLSLLLGFMRDEDAPLWKGYFYATLMFLLSCLQSLFNHQYMYTCFTVGMRVKTAVMGLVYRKSLVINSAARRTCTVGEIVNLVSADTQKLMDFVVYFNAVWLAPIEIALCLFFLWQHLGPSALAGIATVILIFPLNGFIAKKRSKLQVKIQMKFMDGRIRLMNEILNGIKILKFYAWEKAFLEQVLGHREKELKALKNIFFSPKIAFAMFGVYVTLDDRNVLDAQKVFVSMALINILKTPLSQLPFAISTTMQAMVSLRRLGKYLCSEELRVDNVSKAPLSSGKKNGTFSWSAEGPPCLKRINIHVPRGSLVAVVGHVGSGKSSLLSAMLGETEKRTGRVSVKGSVAYVPQQAWIQNATVQDNIIFGREKMKTWYHRVLEACALLPDLDILPAGDATEIGEKGLNLSGGQKQRVSLARAVYRKADVYLLDDPLSAVDAHVGQHIFDKVIGPKGVLRDKTRILVTHGMSFLPQADHILVLVDGEITESGSYQELLSRHGAFADFIHTFASTERKESAIQRGEEIFHLLVNSLFLNILLKNYHTNKILSGSRRSNARLSMVDFMPFSRDLSQEQLIGCVNKHVNCKTDIEMFGIQSIFFFIKLTCGLSIFSRGDTTNTNLQNMEPVSETDQEQVPEDLGKLTEADKARTGRVRLEMYQKYFKTIGLAIIIPIVFLYAFQQGASLAYNYWLSMWADDPVVNGTQIDTDLKLTVFGALGFVQGIAIFGTTVAISICGIIASRHLHMELLINVLRSPMSFFECTPSGNLLNRFAKEIDAIDCMVPDGLKMMLSYVFKLMEVCIIVLMATPFAAVIILPLAFLYAFVQSFYVATSCQLRRLEAVSRSPIYTHFNETVQGASVIRAFGEQPRFILQANQRVDFNQTSYFPRFVATRWLAVNLEFVGNGVVLAAAILSVMGKNTLSPGIVGLAVSHSLQVTGILSWIVRSWTDVENNIVSVERVNEYADTAKEASWSVEGSSLPLAWPQRGTLEFQDYGLQYRKGLELALKGITLNIHERERVGIVGRTGAGKSSLALGIFRILEAAKGKIFIDGVNIADIGLHDLRSRITIIPQVRHLVMNNICSLRMNLDPFDTYTDEEVWRSLELAHLKNFVSNLPDKLNHECSEGGENLSLGQRQLVCLARALLRKTKILVLDEATAAVDLETDTLIQSTIRTQFEDCTVLTIAHRLNTIMDYTRVIVMDRGHISEMDSPANLIAQRGQFYRMCREAGLV
uniref:ABC-type glutathione-S-conjugate transporter n=1 Tax=Dicentrarchus labrax TaxID=13489 RepID=A0A8C4NUZ9_DICLA